jgi:hypothetical protein
MADARLVAYHHGADGFDQPPSVPVAFARDFVHLLFAASAPAARQLAADNPNRSLFRIIAPAETPPLPPADLVSLPTTRVPESASIPASALCVLVRTAPLPAAFPGFRAAAPAREGLLYVREFTELRRTAASDADLHLKTWKLAFLCIAFGHAPSALEWLERARDPAVSDAVRSLAGFRTYDRCLRSLVSAMAQPAPAAEALERFDAEPPIEQQSHGGGVRQRLAGALAVLNGRVPPQLAVPRMRTRELPASAYWMLPQALRPVAVAARRASRAWRALGDGVPVMPSYRTEGNSAKMTPLETQLEAHGFPLLARELRAKGR